MYGIVLLLGWVEADNGQVRHGLHTATKSNPLSLASRLPLDVDQAIRQIKKYIA